MLPLPNRRAPHRWHGGLACLAWLALAVPAFAQVPQQTTYTGRLVDDLGNPVSGPVDLELRIFDAAAGGTQLYGEEHLGVALDATGGFSVQLGQGSSPSSSFDAALFSDTDRWLEVVVDAEVLTPRQPIASVPWALIAQQANEIVPDPTAPRFEDCGDGTVADHQTGLRWEKKTGTPAPFSPIDCGSVVCSDPHEVNNVYVWSGTGTEPDGNAFTDFLARLNGEFDPDAATGCFAGHCDWELPTVSQLQTILIGSEAAPGQSGSCFTAPCVDPAFAAVAGPTVENRYWSSTTDLLDPSLAWYASFNLPGTVDGLTKMGLSYARAVRPGACH